MPPRSRVRGHATLPDLFFTLTYNCAVSTQTIPQTAEIISHDPSTGEEIGRAPLMDASEVAAAVDRARAAQPAWSRLS